MLEIESPTDPRLEVDLEGIQPHQDRGSVTACVEKSQSVVQTVPPRHVQIRERGSELGVALIHRHYTSPGLLRCQSVARSKTRAVRKSFSSAKGAASNCRPIGSFSLVSPQGMLIPGMPARLAVIV